MDPKITFLWMMQCARDGEVDEAKVHAENLLDWLDRGGFAPLLRVSSDDAEAFLVMDGLAEAFCRAACAEVLKPPTPGPTLEP